MHFATTYLGTSNPSFPQAWRGTTTYCNIGSRSRKRVREKGAGHWFEADIADLLTHYDLAADPDAPQWVKDAGEAAYAELDKSSDIFDVWFESGSSWNAVMRERNLGYPAEVYIEVPISIVGGSSSLSYLLWEQPAHHHLRHSLTHGFIVMPKGTR